MQPEVEYVANLTGQPPPIHKSCDDDGKAKNAGGCTRDSIRRKARAANDHHAEEVGETLCALIEIRDPSSTTPARFIKVRAD